MDKRITTTLNVCGILVGAAGIAVLFVQEKYLAGIAVLGIVAFLIFWVIRQARIHSIMYIDFHIYVEFPNKDPRECIMRFEKNLIPKVRNVTTLFHRNMGGPGKIEFVGTNIGEMGPPINEGNLYMVPTIFRSPLPIGEPVIHILYVKSWDCFPDERETFLCFVSEPYKKDVGFHVVFSDSKPCRAAKLYAYEKYVVREIDPPPTITHRGTKLDVVVPSPRFGAKYVLEWEW